MAWTWHQLSFESLDNSASRTLHYITILASGSLDVISPDDVLPADGALCHLFAAVGAGAHVTALQHHTVNLRMQITGKFEYRDIWQ